MGSDFPSKTLKMSYFFNQGNKQQTSSFVRVSLHLLFRARTSCSSSLHFSLSSFLSALSFFNSGLQNCLILFTLELNLACVQRKRKSNNQEIVNQTYSSSQPAHHPASHLANQPPTQPPSQTPSHTASHPAGQLNQLTPICMCQLYRSQ